MKQIQFFRINSKNSNSSILKVKKLKWVTDEIISFRLYHIFYLPLKKFESGQYATLELPVSTGNSTIKRSYSIANWKKNPFYYEFGIKKESNGKGTSWIFDNLKNNDRLKVQHPKGHFHLFNSNTKTIVFIAGGIGIIPLRSMIHALYSNSQYGRKNIEIFLYYSCRYENQLIYHEEFTLLSQLHFNFHYIPILSQPTENWKGKTGRIDADVVMNFVSNFLHADYYLCAGNSLMDSMIQKLESKGVGKNQLFFESFGVSLSEND